MLKGKKSKEQITKDRIAMGVKISTAEGRNLIHLEAKKPQEAVLALIFRGTKILAVSRKDDAQAFGIVGGKIDEGETPEQALVRETFEETGLTIIKYEKIFEQFDGNMNCITYLCETEGEVVVTEKGVVKEVGWPELLAGPFGEYNKALLTHLRNELAETSKKMTYGKNN